MISQVSLKFQEWTRGLDPHKGIISIFEHIRDIPYSLAVPMSDPKTSPEHMLALGKGYCGPKHYLLAEMFRRLGYDVVYATFPFIWNDPDISYPAELRALAEGLPVAYHLACRVRIHDRWVLVDATWDPPLKRAGFPVNEHWDGIGEMRCAVRPLASAVRTAFCRTATSEPCRSREDLVRKPIEGEQDYPDEDDHARDYHRRIGMRTASDKERIRQFYPAFDAWLEQIRTLR